MTGAQKTRQGETHGSFIVHGKEVAENISFMSLIASADAKRKCKLSKNSDNACSVIMTRILH